MRILILLILLPSTIFSQDKSDVIDKFITEGKELWSIPGMSVVIVQMKRMVINLNLLSMKYQSLMSGLRLN